MVVQDHVRMAQLVLIKELQALYPGHDLITDRKSHLSLSITPNPCPAARLEKTLQFCPFLLPLLSFSIPAGNLSQDTVSVPSWGIAVY